MLPQIVLSSLSSVGSIFPDSWLNYRLQHACPPLPKGDLIYDVYMGYPEIFQWDKKRCVAYVSNLYNASLSVFDPYQPKVLETIQFPGLSHPGDTAVNPLHASGIVLRPNNDEPETLELVIDNGDAFYSAGVNISGPDYLITMDIDTMTVTHKLHLNNGLYAGYADAELGSDGNTYVLGVYKSNILRVTPEREISTLFVEEPLGLPRPYGFTGITHAGHAIISNDNTIGQFVRFDTQNSDGTPPVIIQQTPHHNFNTSNVLAIPEKYNSTVLLATENMTPEHPAGGVGVYRSQNKSFRQIEFLGFLPSRRGNSLATCARQMANRIYLVSLPTDGANITVAGHSSHFVFQDLTEDIEALLS
ncbi:hypothetical protein LMH87_003984 [Akanthomyces muscarius]|uniref:TRI14 n=1 Tax=Akanthomyces muscarius TaxID=2231603 RepID=A0A9W8UHG5_AKAMU|nr:hypothetical protein LMH87_003984 [Akanthomyces muscarius]KAJ4145125.1 hypothetical protein LMH87_003984 [Akanthomyces muscarius]